MRRGTRIWRLPGRLQILCSREGGGEFSGGSRRRQQPRPSAPSGTGRKSARDEL
ncbi:unnamed protein product [Scytosiphon promiscuus]